MNFTPLINSSVDFCLRVVYNISMTERKRKALIKKADRLYYKRKKFFKAFPLYLQLADEADENAYQSEYCRFMTAECYHYGYGVGVNYEKAEFYYNKAWHFPSARERLESIANDRLLKKFDLAKSGDKDAQKYIAEMFGENTLAHVLNKDKE